MMNKPFAPMLKDTKIRPWIIKALLAARIRYCLAPYCRMCSPTTEVSGICLAWPKNIIIY